jgi:hypothetical protein
MMDITEVAVVLRNERKALEESRNERRINNATYVLLREYLAHIVDAFAFECESQPTFDVYAFRRVVWGVEL